MTKDMKLKLIDQIRTEEFSAKANELSALEVEFGPDVSMTFLKARRLKIEKDWKAIAENHPRNDIQGLLETLWTWCGDGGFEYTYERKGDTVEMNVTKCPIADMAIRIDEADWGLKCYCCDDESIVKGFNPNIKFERTKTLMEGHECCNHKYTEVK